MGALVELGFVAKRWSEVVVGLWWFLVVLSLLHQRLLASIAGDGLFLVGSDFWVWAIFFPFQLFGLVVCSSVRLIWVAPYPIVSLFVHLWASLRLWVCGYLSIN